MKKNWKNGSAPAIGSPSFCRGLGKSANPTFWIGWEKQNISVAKSFDGDITPEKIIHAVEAVSQTQVKPQKTLIILDEIQSCERALMSLKMFCEEAPEYRIAAAGSLLGVAINREKYTFPVGKVHELTLYPLDFEEFLWANGDEILAEQIREHFKSTEPMPEAAHVKALDRYKQYLIIGGMPAVVNTFVQTKSIIAPVEIQQQILNDYTADMAKYASAYVNMSDFKIYG